MRIGVFGGSFDPIHHGHLAIAEEARVALGLREVLVIPTAQQPHKPGGARASAHARLAMAERACAGNPSLRVSDLEVRRAPPSYTVDTLAALAQPGHELFLILGADAAAGLARWYQAARVLELAHMIAIGRPGVKLDLAALDATLPGIAQRVTHLDGPELTISSSAIRARVAAGRPIRYLVPDAVRTYIVEHGLYRPQETLV